MAYKPNNHSGAASYNSWMQLDQNIIDAIKAKENPEDNLLALDPENRKYARLVYVINLNPDDIYSKLVQEGGGFTYNMWAIPGSDPSEPKWKIQRIDSIGNITWPNSNRSFTFIANDYLTYTYSI
jgi:hypothetical protein